MPIQQTINIQNNKGVEITGVTLVINDLCDNSSITLTHNSPEVTLSNSSIEIISAFGSCIQLEGTGTLFYRYLENDCSTELQLIFSFIPGVQDITLFFEDIDINWNGELIKRCNSLRLPTIPVFNVQPEVMSSWIIPTGASTVGSKTVHEDDCYYYFYVTTYNTLRRYRVAREGNSDFNFPTSVFPSVSSSWTFNLPSVAPFTDSDGLAHIRPDVYAIGDMLLNGDLLYLFPMHHDKLYIIDVNNGNITTVNDFPTGTACIERVGDFVYCFSRLEGLCTNTVVFSSGVSGKNRIIKFSLIDNSYTLIPLNKNYECYQVEKYNEFLYSLSSADNIIIRLNTNTDTVEYLLKNNAFTNYNAPGYFRIINNFLFYGANNWSALIRRNLDTDVETLELTGLANTTIFPNTWIRPRMPSPFISIRFQNLYYFFFYDSTTRYAFIYNTDTDTFSLEPYNWFGSDYRYNRLIKGNVVKTPMGDFWGETCRYTDRDATYFYDFARAWFGGRYQQNRFIPNQIEYLTTTNANQVNITGLNTLNFTFSNVSFNNTFTFIGILLSFDNRNSWGIFTDSNTFVTLVNNIDLDSHNWFTLPIGSRCMTPTQLTNLNNIDISSYTTLDIAIAMSTTNAGISPSLQSLNILAVQ